MKYIVQSDRLVGHDKGDIVSADDLRSVAVLVAAGHVKPQPKPATAKKEDK